MKLVYEKVPSSADRSFHLFEQRPPRFHAPFHYHPEWELTEIVRGEGYRHVGDHRADFRAGDLALIGANVPHAYFSYPDHPLEGGCHARVMQFDAGRLLAAIEPLPESRTLHPLTALAARGASYTGETATRVRALFAALTPLTGLTALAHVLTLLDALAAAPLDDVTALSSPTFTGLADAGRYDPVNRACALLGERYAEPLALTEVARAVGLSESGFSRVFRRATGRTFIAYLNEVRIGSACRLLLESERTIAQIADECGFGNLSNFNRRFRALRGETPRAFRERGRSAFLV